MRFRLPAGSQFSLHAPVELRRLHVSISYYVALINLIIAQHEPREKDDSMERVITLTAGFCLRPSSFSVGRAGCLLRQVNGLIPASSNMFL